MDSSHHLARARRLLLLLYVLTAVGDTAVKTLAAGATLDGTVTRLLPRGAVGVLQSARRPSGNFEIFRSASRRLIQGQDIYTLAGELQDRFKYSPTFAFLFAPLAWLPWPVALFLWSALNALLLFFAVERLLPERAACIALTCLWPEVLRSMQNAQSNALVAALIILAFLSLERQRVWSAAGPAMIGAFIKIFPLAALTFAIPRRTTIRAGAASAIFAVVLVLAPLLVTSPALLLAQYRSWGMTEAADAQQRWFSAMALVHHWLGTAWPNWPIQLAGTILLLAPLAWRRDRWTDRAFRNLYLCSVLVFVTLFNHQAERSSYLIAFTGATIWFVGQGRSLSRNLLYPVALVTIPLMSTLIPVPYAFRTPTAMLFRLAVPMLAMWIAIQWDLLTSASPRDSRRAAVEAAT